MADAELPPRSAVAERLARPPVLSLGLGLGSAGSLRPPAALMSVEEEPAAEGQGTKKQDSEPGLGKGHGCRGWGEPRGSLIQGRSSAGLCLLFVSGRTPISQRGQRRGQRDEGFKISRWSEAKPDSNPGLSNARGCPISPCSLIEFRSSLGAPLGLCGSVFPPLSTNPPPPPTSAQKGIRPLTRAQETEGAGMGQ